MYLGLQVLMNKARAIIFTKCFMHSQAEQIKTEVASVQIFVQKHRRVYFQVITIPFTHLKGLQ